MTPQAMPEAPEAIPDLSRTRTSAPLPRPDRRRDSARCQAVESPWMPAPTIRYLLAVGKAIELLQASDGCPWDLTRAGDSGTSVRPISNQFKPVVGSWSHDVQKWSDQLLSACNLDRRCDRRGSRGRERRRHRD